MAVGYIGRALLERQTLMAAARHAAREASLAATRSPLDKATGAGIVQQAGTAGARVAAISAAAQGRPAESAPPRWEPITGAHMSQLKFRPVGQYGLAMVAEKSETVDGLSMKFGIGLVLYGARAKERLGFLEPVRKATQGASQANPQPARGLTAPLEISASAYMPGELPAKSPAGIGLIELNPWIKKVLEEE
ncbi:MAG: hypothetical protein FJZ00_13450 [Candidatus Sericytochromatia bacterium]|uniref:Uncharacterized protein n=1 Tax=Candidatus Tanganyikabacteria bacterium TaxID=2961651 RepID=A0A938BP79_9BACT|nr:hypothetical protein [Candidatus Tanganyikabacteria bacterium]